jgi:hypothetical protein
MFDYLPVWIHMISGTIRSRRRQLLFLASLAISLLEILFLWLYCHAMNLPYGSPIGAQCVHIFIVFCIYLLDFQVPGPGRFPKDYKPFIKLSTDTDLQLDSDDEDGSGYLAGLFAEQQRLLPPLRQRRPHSVRTSSTIPF